MYSRFLMNLCTFAKICVAATLRKLMEWWEGKTMMNKARLKVEFTCWVRTGCNEQDTGV